MQSAREKIIELKMTSLFTKWCTEDAYREKDNYDNFYFFSIPVCVNYLYV